MQFHKKLKRVVSQCWVQGMQTFRPLNKRFDHSACMVLTETAAAGGHIPTIKEVCNFWEGAGPGDYQRIADVASARGHLSVIVWARKACADAQISEPLRKFQMTTSVLIDKICSNNNLSGFAGFSQKPEKDVIIASLIEGFKYGFVAGRQDGYVDGYEDGNNRNDYSRANGIYLNSILHLAAEHNHLRVAVLLCNWERELIHENMPSLIDATVPFGRLNMLKFLKARLGRSFDEEEIQWIMEIATERKYTKILRWVKKLK